VKILAPDEVATIFAKRKTNAQLKGKTISGKTIKSLGF